MFYLIHVVFVVFDAKIVFAVFASKVNLDLRAKFKKLCGLKMFDIQFAN